jgi:hypothetical protein
MDSYPTQTSGESQVQIVKIRSPRLSRENSRNSSTERSPSRERLSNASLKKPEQAGILKKPSPKFGKASENRFSNSLRPDSFISPFSSFESKSDKMSPSSEILPSNFVRESKQRASFSDYEREMQQQQLKEQQQQQLHSQHHYHQAAMKSRSLESSLELLKPAIKQQSSYEYTSPSHHCDPMRFYSLSSQPSIESNRSPIRYYSPIPPHQPFYEQPFHEYPLSKHIVQQQQQHVKPRRESRSLERPQFSRQSSSELERERFYQDETPYNRRHSFYGEQQHHSIPQHYYSTSSPDDFLMSHYEQPSACVDCYYQTHRRNLYQQQQQPPPLPQRNSSQQQQQPKSPSATMKRQSRSRKKLSRRMSSNYFNKSFDDDGGTVQQCNAAVVGKQLNDNEEIRV